MMVDNTRLDLALLEPPVFTAQVAAALGWFAARSTVPTLLCGTDGRILWRNAAQAELESGGTLDGLFTDQARSAVKLNVVGIRTPHPRAADGPLVSTVAAGSGETRYLVQIETTEVDAASGTVFMIQLKPVGERRRYLWADLTTALGLTKTEALIVQSLVEGRAIPAIAADLGKKNDTIKTHLKRIYSKTGAKTREELFGKVLPFRTE